MVSYLFFFNFNMSILFYVFQASHHKNLVGLDFESFDMSRLDEIEREWIFPFWVAHLKRNRPYYTFDHRTTRSKVWYIMSYSMKLYEQMFVNK